jgi:hypothetical protein
MPRTFPLPFLDSTLSALLEDDQPSEHDVELLLPIDYVFVAAAVAASGDETQSERTIDLFAGGLSDVGESPDRRPAADRTRAMA